MIHHNAVEREHQLRSMSATIYRMADGDEDAERILLGGEAL